nr:hypothetical protein [Tanacetum cinerariifolium]
SSYTGEAAPKLKASARKKKGDSASSTTPPNPTPITTVVSAPRLSDTAKDVQRIEAEQLKIVLKRSRQETHISQQSGYGTDEGTEEELAKDDDEETETGKGGDEVSESKGSEEESDDEEDQELRLIEEARIQEEEEADELYRDVNINQGRGLQVTQNVEDSHVTLTPVNPDGPQESSSM